MDVEHERRPKKMRKRRLALVLPGHNEELIITTTIQSAIAAGLSIKDIYVVDDCSSDQTRALALKQLPLSHVLTVPRSGKARAVIQAIRRFNIVDRYEWVHIADADSVFCPDYFRIYKRHLNAKKYAAAVGFVQSMRGNWIATYRSFSYTYGQHIFRRLQAWLGVISVLPGPVTCFRTDIIRDLDFAAESLTEDFDLTLQIHRKKLGRIRFIPEAVNFTQDPRTIKDFYNQTLRWQRGFFQGVRKYHIGLRPHWIDVGVGYQMGESVYYLLQLFILAPLLIITTKSWLISGSILLADYAAIVVLAIFSAITTRRPAILLSLIYFYALRFLELFVFIQAFVEVIILRRHKVVTRGWETEGRRFELNTNDIKALQ
jgi:poly-beta-1,6-N-acetyl-D-glucosamine synthase